MALTAEFSTLPCGDCCGVFGQPSSHQRCLPETEMKLIRLKDCRLNRNSLGLIYQQVCLWLGANVMLEYSLDDAEDLLRKNKESAEKTIAQTAFDLVRTSNPRPLLVGWH